MADLSDDGGPKSGRVRKKSAKVLEMEEFEEAEKKQFSKKTDAPKCGKTPPAPSPTNQPPAKKQKLKVEKTELSPVAKQPPVTPPPQPKASPQSAKTAQTPSSVIKFLLSSPAIPTTPSVSTKAVTKTSPNSELSPGQVSPNVKKTLKSKVKLEPGFMALEDDDVEPVSTETVQVPVKQELDIKSKLIVSPAQQVTSPSPVFTPPTSSSRPIDAAGSMDSLKMKLILSPKEKKPKVSFEQMLESGNEATALALAKSVKKKKKKSHDGSSKDPVKPKPAPPAEVQSASEAMPNLAALVTSSKKKTPSKKKSKPTPAPELSTPTMESALAAAFNPSKLSDSPIDVEYEPNLVIADETDKVKPKKKLVSSGSKSKKKPSHGTSKHEGSGPAPPEGDIAALAAKVKVGDKKGKKKEKEESELLSKKRKRPPTAYTLYCNAHRAKLVAENPGIDFAQISRRLGEMWQTLTKKEKWCWRRKAKKLAGKGSTLISTGKGNKPKPAAAPATATSTAPAAPSAPSLPTAKPMVPHQGARIAKATVEESALSPIKGFGTEPVDVAAHLKLLGESLSIIGMRLQEHKGLIAVQGSMSVLLDSLLCSFGPLMCLTQQVPELNGCSRQIHAKTLDHIAYVMPGL